MPKGQSDPWKDIRLPNAGSKCATPASLTIDIHYEEMRVWRRWDWERFVRLCNFLRLTPGELASTACISHWALEQFERRNRLYNGRSADRSGALVLTLLEAHVASAFTTDVVANPFPDLQAVAPVSSSADEHAS